MKRILSLLICAVLVLSLLPATTARAATTVSSVSFTLAYPEAGKTPPGTATWLTQGYSIHSIDWYDCTTDQFLETGDKIQADHQYRATLWVEVMDGYTFACKDDNTPTVTAYVNGENCEVYKAFEYKAWAMVCVDYDFQLIPAKGWIKSVDLTVPAPAAGAKPSYAQLAGTGYETKNVYFSGQTDENMKNGIAWYAKGGDAVNPDTGVFAAETAYEFRCLVFPKDGYRITRNATATVNGKPAEASLDYDLFLSVGYQFPKTGAAFHTHFYTDWAWNSGQHYKNCTDCDDVFFVESHKGGTATCEADGKCTVCGYAYIKASEDLHTPDTSKWIARVDKYHYHPCKICGAHCDIGDHVPGPAGTPDAAVVCRDCGYIITPAKNHKHDLTKVPAKAATCTEQGCVEHYTCSGCSQIFSDGDGRNVLTDETVLVPLGHSVSDTWAKDGQSHWRSCATCGQVMEETRMNHEFAEGTCTTCGYKEDGSIPAETTEKPERSAKSEAGQEKNKGKNDLLLLVMLPLVCFGAAITATVIILKRKRK